MEEKKIEWTNSKLNAILLVISFNRCFIKVYLLLLYDIENGNNTKLHKKKLMSAQEKMQNRAFLPHNECTIHFEDERKAHTQKKERKEQKKIEVILLTSAYAVTYCAMQSPEICTCVSKLVFFYSEHSFFFSCISNNALIYIFFLHLFWQFNQFSTKMRNRIHSQCVLNVFFVCSLNFNSNLHYTHTELLHFLYIFFSLNH